MDDPLTIANCFNDVFVNIGPQLAENIPNSSLNYKYYLDMPIQESMFTEPTTAEEITKFFRSLKDTAAGYDGFNRAIISQISPLIFNSLVHVINLSLLYGVVSTEIKTAKVKPLFKGDYPHLLNNYRPISILPLLSKLFEKTMHCRI